MIRNSRKATNMRERQQKRDYLIRVPQTSIYKRIQKPTTL
jgi:hypothetical protein